MHFLISVIFSFLVAFMFVYKQYSVRKKLLKFADEGAHKRLLANFDAKNFKTKMTICIVIPLLYGVVYHLICVRHKYQQASTVALILIILMFVESLISTRSN